MHQRWCAQVIQHKQERSSHWSQYMLAANLQYLAAPTRETRYVTPAITIDDEAPN